MPRRIQGPDGKIHEFPDDFTDAEVSSALESVLPKSSQLETPAAKPTKWSDRLGLNTGDASPLLGLAKGSGAAAVDMTQGVMSNAMRQVKDLASGMLHGDSSFYTEPNTPAEEARLETMVPDTPDTVAGKVGYVLPTAAELAYGGGKAGAAAIDAIPSTARAGRNFQEVMGAAEDLPVSTDAARDIAAQIKVLASHGSSLPKVVNDFLKAVPEKGPSLSSINYRTAREFASNLAAITREEAMSVKPAVLRQVAIMGQTLNKAIAETAHDAGKLAEYQSAMREYARAMKLQGVAEAAIDGAKKAVVPFAAGAGAAGWWAGHKLKSLFGAGE